jgi:hypothetical protein
MLIMFLMFLTAGRSTNECRHQIRILYEALNYIITIVHTCTYNGRVAYLWSRCSMVSLHMHLISNFCKYQIRYTEYFFLEYVIQELTIATCRKKYNEEFLQRYWDLKPNFDEWFLFICQFVSMWWMWCPDSSFPQSGAHNGARARVLYFRMKIVVFFIYKHRIHARGGGHKKKH